MVKTSSKQMPHTKPQNSLEKTQHFKGVRMRKWGKWVSEVRVPNSTARIWLGSFDSPQQAARAYDCAVYCLRGRNAKFNFPDFLPEIPSASALSSAQIQAAAVKFAREEFQQPLENGAAYSRSEPHSCIDSRQILEEQNCKLLDLLLQDAESNQCLGLEDFPALDLEDIDFLLLEEKQGGLFLPWSLGETGGFQNSH